VQPQPPQPQPPPPPPPQPPLAVPLASGSVGSFRSEVSDKPPAVPPASGNARQAIDYLREMRTADGPPPPSLTAHAPAGRPPLMPHGAQNVTGGGGASRMPNSCAMSRPGCSSGLERPVSAATASRTKGSYALWIRGDSGGA
jgi:hypothetical protein